jgi:hypothetical protein
MIKNIRLDSQEKAYDKTVSRDNKDSNFIIYFEQVGKAIKEN